MNNYVSLFLIGGDFNVDFNRVSCHTALLDSFCTNFHLLPVTRHANSVLDYSYTFSMSRFSILDHFLLSSDLLFTSVESAFVSHKVVIIRPSSLGEGRILRRTLSVRLSLCPSVRPSRYRCHR